MRFKKISAAVMAAFLGFSSLAVHAQPRGEDSQQPQQRQRASGAQGAQDRQDRQQGRPDASASSRGQRGSGSEARQGGGSSYREPSQGGPSGGSSYRESSQGGPSGGSSYRDSSRGGPSEQRGRDARQQQSRGPDSFHDGGAPGRSDRHYPAQASRGAGPQHDYFRGDRLPPEARRGHVVDNWRDHRLDPPPQGHQWVRVGTDFVLIAVATGIITQIILSSQGY